MVGEGPGKLLMLLRKGNFVCRVIVKEIKVEWYAEIGTITFRVGWK